MGPCIVRKYCELRTSEVKIRLELLGQVVVSLGIDKKFDFWNIRLYFLALKERRRG